MSILKSRTEAQLPVPVPTLFEKGWGFARLLARPRFARKLVTLATSGYLAQTGWVRSVMRRSGELELTHPLPWATFPYIAFIEARLGAHLRIFEYGSGASTLYYAQRGCRVVAVEHDVGFANALAPHLPPNATVLLEELHSDAYVRSIERDGGEFDFVSVDGRDRVKCLAAAMTRLHPAGVVVLDDAERPDYAAGTTLLINAGFRRLDFVGLAPEEPGVKSTAVFYRRANCLGL